MLGTLGLSLTVACGASAWNSGTVYVLCRERLWVVVDLKRRQRNSLNAWMSEWNDFAHDKLDIGREQEAQETFTINFGSRNQCDSLTFRSVMLAKTIILSKLNEVDIDNFYSGIPSRCRVYRMLYWFSNIPIWNWASRVYWYFNKLTFYPTILDNEILRQRGRHSRSQ